MFTSWYPIDHALDRRSQELRSRGQQGGDDQDGEGDPVVEPEGGVVHEALGHAEFTRELAEHAMHLEAVVLTAK